MVPRVLISECLGFSACRFDGSIFREDMIEKLKKYVEFVPFCPEMEIGLGVPREVLRLYLDEEQVRLHQKETGKDFTQDIIDLADKYADYAKKVEGAIFKTRSPTCAYKDAKIYAGVDNNITAKRGPGLFCQKLLGNYPDLPSEDEGRLKNATIRENFLTKIFTLARFHQIEQYRKVKDLLEFHANHKFLYMIYNETKMREMGRLLARQKEFSNQELFEKYREGLLEILSNEDSPGKKINVLMHIMGFFKDKATGEEKSFLLDTIEKYRGNQLPLSVPINILRSWVVKYEDEYLKSQYFFTPFPDELMTMEDSGKTDRPR